MTESTPNDPTVPAQNAGDVSASVQSPPQTEQAIQTESSPPVEGADNGTYAAQKGDDKTEAASDEGDAKPRHRRNRTSAQARISQLTSERDIWKAEALKAREAGQDATPSGNNTAAAAGEGAPKQPNPDDYPGGEFSDAYKEALVDYKMEQKLQAYVAQQAQHQARAQEAQRKAEIGQQYQKLADTDPDRLELVEDGLAEIAAVNQALAQDIVMHAPDPLQALTVLGQHPEEASKIARMSGAAAHYALGQLVGRATAPQSKPAPVTGAPPPPKTAGARGGANTNLETASYAEFRKMRGFD